MSASLRIISPFAAVAVVAMALLLTAATIASASAAQTRDHRGSNGASQGGVTVDGKAAKVLPAPKLGGDKFKGGFEQLKGPVAGKGSHTPATGPTIRDHRRIKPSQTTPGPRTTGV